jgi:hypothetical protein
MKKKNLIIISASVIVLIAVFLIYVIPYGNSVKLFDSGFDEFNNNSEKQMNVLNSTGTIKEYNIALVKFLSIPSELNNFKTEFEKIKSEENFVKNIWIKSSTTIEKINSLQKDIFDTYKRFPQLVSNVIKKDCESRIMHVSNVSDIAKLTQIGSEIKSDYDDFIKGLTNLVNSNDFAQDKISFSNIKSDKVFINKLGDNIIGQIKILRNNEYNKTKLSLSQIQSIKEASKTTNDYILWIKSAKSLVNQSSELGANNNQCIATNSNLDSDIKEMKSFLELYSNIIDAENKSNSILKNAISLMDNANSKLQNMEKFASSSDIRTVYDSWSQAENEVVSARYALDNRKGNSEFQTIWNNVVSKPRNNIDKIQQEVSKHKSFVYNEYQKAVQQESSFVGSTTRDVQRGFNRLANWAKAKTQEVAQSRIGKEISISTKMLILGTKAFYDLQNPNTDPTTWAMSYEGDVNQIMKETDEVMSMDGPSLTGKNTPIEAFVNSAYSSSFNK